MRCSAQPLLAATLLVATSVLLTGCASPRDAMDKAMEDARTERESTSDDTRQHDDAMDRMERRREQQ
ncbi:MAG: hypothetical protein ACQERR_08250 [Pseudomonadota bacterium]